MTDENIIDVTPTKVTVKAKRKKSAEKRIRKDKHTIYDVIETGINIIDNIDGLAVGLIAHAIQRKLRGRDES